MVPSPPSTDTFWQQYRSFVAQLFNPLKSHDGTPEQNITAAEAKLGFNMPAVLRDLYLLCGRRKDIHQSFERLLLVEELYVHDGILVFYDENQSVCIWGIDTRNTANINPPVVRSDYDDQMEWKPQQNYLTDFLAGMLFVQAINGGMPYTGFGSAREQDIDRLTADWQVINHPGEWGFHGYLRPGQLIQVHQNILNRISITAGVRDKKDLHTIAAALNITFSGIDD